jgi:predicted dehydrogenase
MLNVALIGLGWWGQTILRTLRGSAKLRIVRAVDANPTLGDVVKPEGIAFSADLRAALDDPAVEAVILCTPHSLHAGQILAAASAGRHVFCEKPLTLTRDDAERAVAACRRAGIVLGVGHERRFEPPVIELRRLVRAGGLGTLLQIEANFSQDKFLSLPADNWRLSAKEAPAGPLTATGIHLLDLAVSFLGPAARVTASVRQLGSNLANGDTLAALVEFKSGAHALISAILATPFAGRFALYGNAGWAEIRDVSHPENSEGWALIACRRGERPVTADYPGSSAVRANLEAFAEVATGGALYPVPGDEMIAAIAAFEAVVRSATSGAVESVD